MMRNLLGTCRWGYWRQKWVRFHSRLDRCCRAGHQSPDAVVNQSRNWCQWQALTQPLVETMVKIRCQSVSKQNIMHQTRVIQIRVVVLTVQNNGAASSADKQSRGLANVHQFHNIYALWWLGLQRCCYVIRNEVAHLTHRYTCMKIKAMSVHCEWWL